MLENFAVKVHCSRGAANETTGMIGTIVKLLAKSNLEILRHTPHAARRLVQNPAAAGTTFGKPGTPQRSACGVPCRAGQVTGKKQLAQFSSDALCLWLCSGCVAD